MHVGMSEGLHFSAFHFTSKHYVLLSWYKSVTYTPCKDDKWFLHLCI